VGLLSLHLVGLLSLLALYLGVLKARMHCLFIGKHPAFVLQKTRSKWHQLVLQVAPNWCPHLLT